MKSRRKSSSPEQQAARKSGRLPWAELPTVNACLELICTGETGQTEWKTFPGWQEAGFGVMKGAKGFPIWGRPISCRDAGDPQNQGPAQRAFEYFPVSYLFHAGQVVDANGQPYTASTALNPFLMAIKVLPLALPAPREVAS